MSDTVELVGTRGTTTIADGVVAKVAALAAREVPGVALGGPAGAGLNAVVDRLRGQDTGTAGVGVEVGRTQTAIDLAVRIDYPDPIKDVADRLRERVTERVEAITGLEVVEVNVQVVDLVFPSAERSAGPAQGQARVR